MKSVFLVHHKTGTVFFKVALSYIASKFQRQYLFIEGGEVKEKIGDGSRTIAIISNPNEECFNKFKTLFDNAVTFHSIRDPFGLIISSTKYHQISNESWLHIPKKEFNGMTYSEKINSLNYLEAIRFEMSNNSRFILDNMSYISKNYNFINLWLEDISHDRTLKAFYLILTKLGFDGIELVQALRILAENALWRQGKTEHSTLGVPTKTSEVFPTELLNSFHELFPNWEKELGFYNQKKSALYYSAQF